jgi:hypothetical protein
LTGLRSVDDSPSDEQYAWRFIPPRSVPDFGGGEIAPAIGETVWIPTNNKTVNIIKEQRKRIEIQYL